MIKQYLFTRSADGTENGGGAQPVLIGVATPEQIQEWKEKYKQGIYAVEIDGHVAYFQNPTRIQMNAAMSRASADRALDMYETLAKNTFLGGSGDVLKEDELFFGLTQHLKTKMDGKKGNLVNL